VTADTTYGNGEFLQWLADRNITLHADRDSVHRKNIPSYGPERGMIILLPSVGANTSQESASSAT